MGSFVSRRRRRRKSNNSTSTVVAGGGSAFVAPQSLNQALLSTYKQGLDQQEIALQFDSPTGKQLQRFWICKALVDKPIFIDILSYLRGPELMTSTEICRTWYDCANESWLWDAVDGIYGMGDVSMGRYDYRCRHHRMRLTREEKRRHRARIAGMEIAEHREKMYKGDARNVEVAKKKAMAIVKSGKLKAFGCSGVSSTKRSVSGGET